MSKIFNEVFAAVTNVVEFDPAWKNNTGYLNGATDPIHALPSGKIVKCVDDFGRNVLLVGTPLGNVAVFYRYADNRKTVVSNWPSPALAKMYGAHSALNETQLELILGGYQWEYENVGKALEAIVNSQHRLGACALSHKVTA